MTVCRIRLIHWNAAEAQQRAERLRDAGYKVACEVPEGPVFLRELRNNPPTAVVIDLARLPAQGRDMALAIRKYKTTRHVPLVFVSGESEKVERIMDLLPDAVYTTWSRIGGALKQAINQPLSDPIVPLSLFVAYAGKPLAEKLGIRANTEVAMVDAPEGFRQVLGNLPDGVTLRNQTHGRCDLIIWFIRSRRALQRGMKHMADRAAHGLLWIAWPKKDSSMDTDLSQQYVREVGLAAGLVDYKICAIDGTWSGLCFTHRKPKDS